MFNLLQNATDDQTAIGACVLTLAGAAFFVFASFHLGPAGQKLRNRERNRLNGQRQSEPVVSTVPVKDRAA